MTIGVAYAHVHTQNDVERCAAAATAATVTTPGGWWAANGGGFPSPLLHRSAMCIGVLSSAMSLRYDDRLCRIMPRAYVRTSERVHTRSARSIRSPCVAGGWKMKGGGGKERETGHHSLYGDQGGCPVFRVTWLNGIALAHSCPHRRDGRLASRFFPPLSPALVFRLRK